MVCDSENICESLPDTCSAFGLSCRSGQTCAADQAVCVDIGGCGDGIVEPGEACDDGNIVDGMIVGGIFVLDECSHDCKFAQDPLCGNNIFNPDTGEECDTGPTDSAACNSNMAGPVSCKLSRCGDGYTNLAAMEECDSSGVDTVQCNGKICTMPSCGDNYINIAAGEECESGGLDTPTCNGKTAGPAACHSARCGDGHVNLIFIPNGQSNVETCDNLGGVDTMTCNGNNGGKDGPGACQFAKCGDGYANAQAGEGCDGGTTDTKDCNGTSAPSSLQCQPTKCGDNYVNHAAGETCDSSSGNDTSTCNGNKAGIASCQFAKCGDGYLNLLREECESDPDCAAPQHCSSCKCI